MICLSDDDIKIYFESVNQVGKFFNTSPSNIRKYIRESKQYRGYNITKVDTETNDYDIQIREIINTLDSIYWNNVCIRVSILILIFSYLYNYL